MKILTVLSLLLSLSAFAQERVELGNKEVSVNAAEALLVRTNKTPSTVEVTFNVPMEKAVCERYETRMVLRTSAFDCGEDIRTRRVSMGRVCVAQDSNGRCRHYREEWRVEQYRVPRTCMVPESYCAQYGTALTFKRDTMKIKFKGLPALSDSEFESFYVEADQKTYDSNNVIYKVTPHETLREYKVKQKKILGFKVDSYEIREK